MVFGFLQYETKLLSYSSLMLIGCTSTQFGLRYTPPLAILNDNTQVGLAFYKKNSVIIPHAEGQTGTLNF